MLPSYPKVFALGHKAIAELMFDPVYIQEKVDGSQISFGNIGGSLQARSHHKEIQIGGHFDSMFDKAVDTIKKLGPKLTTNYIYRGEYLRSPHHNTLTYDRVPSKNIILFDIMAGPEDYLPYNLVSEEAKRLGLEVVPLYDVGTITDLDQLESYLKTESCLGGTTIEGVVVKNYERFGIDKHVLMGKYVSEKFKEKNGATHKTANSKDVITKLASAYGTEARWRKAIQHLREQDLLANEPKDIGPLIKEINLDILEECKDEIMEALFKHFWAMISKKITYGFPEFYKKYLAEQQFGDTE